MLRRSLSDHNKKCSMKKSQDKPNRHRRGSKKRYGVTSAFSSSTIFSCCAISAILCLTIQTKLYSDTIYERKPFLSTTTSISKGDHPQHQKQEQSTQREDIEPIRKDDTTIEFITDSRSLEDTSFEHHIKEDPKKKSSDSLMESSQKKNYPPRIVHYDNSQSDFVELKYSHIPGSNNVSTPSDRVTEKAQRGTFRDANVEDQSKKDKLDGGSVNSEDGVDEEDPESAVEDKNAIQNDDADEPAEQCVPLAKWQSTTPVNCNVIHEIDMLLSILNTGKPIKKYRHTPKSPSFNISSHIHHESFRHPTWNESQMKFLGQGWFREAWKLDRQPPGQLSTDKNDDNNDDGETVILKMLRPERDFTTEFYELHRIDAVAMEQLTHSKFVLDVYAYCGQSVLNEYASFRIPELSSLEKFDRQLRGKDSPKVNRMKLKLAIGVATGVAHVHELPADIVGDNRPTLAHYDLNPRNVAIVKGGMPKLNDFNVAHFLKYNPATNLTCGFDSRLHEPWWRAPEEVSLNATGKLTHAVDIWSLGNLLFHILTSHSPRGKMKDYRIEPVRQDVLKGIPPPLPTEFLESTDPAVVTFRQAMDMCFVKDPSDRATAREVTNVLFGAYLKIVEAEKKKENKKHH